MGDLDLLAAVTTRLASVVRLDDVVEVATRTAIDLGFSGAWLSVLDEQGATQPLTQGQEASVETARETRSLPLQGSRKQTIGRIRLASERGAAALSDSAVAQGVVRAFLDHVGLALERALQVGQLETRLDRAQTAITDDARLKAIGELAASAAHDLNNLSGIALLAVSVGMRSASEAFDALPRIERANRAIGDLVARLQRIARPPSAESEAADLKQVIDDLLIMAAPVLREQLIEVATELPAVPLVRCDPVLVHQVLLNLLLNASDALGEVAGRSRTIMIRVSHDDAAIRVRVSDNGPGLPPDVLARLFQPFMTTKSRGHLGLGLAAAKTALGSYGATLDARNAPTGGAVFEVAFAAAALGVPPHATPARPLPMVPDRPRRARILAVDDDPDVVYIIRAFLEPLGYELATATGSAQALAAASEQEFDLVLCDIGLPKQSGLDVCRQLRAAGFQGKLVLMTGWDTHALSSDERAAECDTLLKKPFVGSDLIQVIDTLLA